MMNLSKKGKYSCIFAIPRIYSYIFVFPKTIITPKKNIKKMGYDRTLCGKYVRTYAITYILNDPEL